MKTRIEELSEWEKKSLIRYIDFKKKGKNVLAGLIRTSELNDVDLEALEKQALEE